MPDLYKFITPFINNDDFFSDENKRNIFYAAKEFLNYINSDDGNPTIIKCLDSSSIPIFRMIDYLIETVRYDDVRLFCSFLNQYRKLDKYLWYYHHIRIPVDAHPTRLLVYFCDIDRLFSVLGTGGFSSFLNNVPNLARRLDVNQLPELLEQAWANSWNVMLKQAIHSLDYPEEISSILYPLDAYIKNVELCNDVFHSLDDQQKRDAVLYIIKRLALEILLIDACLLHGIPDPDLNHMKQSCLRKLMYYNKLIRGVSLLLKTRNYQRASQVLSKKYKRSIDFRQEIIEAFKKIKTKYSEFTEILRSPEEVTHLLNMMERWGKKIIQFEIEIKDPELFIDKTQKYMDEQVKILLKTKGKDSVHIRYEIKGRTIPRLKIIAASLDNAYSMESPLFQFTPIPKIIKNNHTAELVCLKKWGSTTSVFQKNKSLMYNLGGGFFIYQNGYGLVIDPGPDFIKNLETLTDFDLTDIHGIVVSHPHYDHIGDLQRILLGIRELNSLHCERKIDVLLPDRRFYQFLPKWTREKYIKILNHTKKEKFKIPSNDTRNGFCVKPFQVIHHLFSDPRVPANNQSYGFVIELISQGKSISRIGYFADCQYSETHLPDEPMDIIILDISSTRVEDILNNDSTTIATKSWHGNWKRNHLGYSGTLALLRHYDLIPIALISEFFEPQSRSDCRLYITGSLEHDIKECGQKTKVLAAEIGMRMQIDSKKTKVFCSVNCNPDDGGFIDPSEPGFLQHRFDMFNRNSLISTKCKRCMAYKTKTGAI